MKTNVLLREHQKTKTIGITDDKKPIIEDELLDKWQNILNIIVDIIGVSSALIMKITPDNMEVFLSSENKENPYEPSDSEALGTGLYCETVIGLNKELYIKNALKKDNWSYNPKIDSDIISYYGLPIRWPDSRAYGTLCILDKSEIQLKRNHKLLFRKLKKSIEDDLAILIKNQQLKKIFNINLDLLCIADTEGDFIEVNTAWADLLGYKVCELEHQNYMDFVHPEDIKITYNALEKLKNNKEITNFVNRFRDKEGNYHYIEWQSNFNTEENYFYASARDITYRILQSREGLKKEDQLNFILKSMDAGAFEWDIKTGKTIVDINWAKMLGYTLEEVKGINVQDWEEYTHPEDLEKAKIQLQKTIKEKAKIHSIDMRMKHKQGHWVWVNSRGKIVKWTKDNKPLKMFGIHMNIDERKIKEEAIKETKVKLENLSSQVPGVLYQFQVFANKKICFPFISDGVYEVFKVTADEIYTNPENAFRMIHDNDRKKVKDAIEKSGKHLNQLHETFRLVLSKNDIKWVEVKSVPEKLSDNSVLWHGYIGDITEKVNKQNELETQHMFQKTLAEVSTSLLNISTTNFDKKIEHALGKISEMFQIDRSYILEFDETLKHFSLTHEWCEKTIESHKNSLQNIKSNAFPWWMKKLLSNEMIYIRNLNDLPQEATIEKKILEVKNIQSIVVNPIFIENNFYGFFGFDCVKSQKNFSKDDLKLLKIFTNIMKNTFAKHINDIKIQELTYKDSLTGLYNRRFFEKELLKLDTIDQLPLSIIAADINGLKIVNDSLGHKKGDELIIRCADILASVTRKCDIVSRQGGDEFLILLPNTNKEETEKIIQQIKCIAKKVSTGENVVTMAIGSSVKVNGEQDIEKTLRLADDNMYQNKLSNGRSIKSKIVKNLLNSLEVKSNETKEHSLRMTQLAIRFGKKLSLDHSEINRLSLLATLHDIGKITISEKILKKPGKLTNEEWNIMKSHPESGFKIASSSEEFALVANEIYCHHERWDGFGYPRGLKEKEIPYLSRVLSIIDAYDVMTHDRPYSKAISKKKALEEVETCAGHQFDPEISKIFIEMMNNNIDYLL